MSTLATLSNVSVGWQFGFSLMLGLVREDGKRGERPERDKTRECEVEKLAKRRRERDER